MKTQPIRHPSPNPIPKRKSDPISFGIYKGTKYTHYGHKDFGIYRENNIEIFHDKKDNMKLQYISDKFRNFIKSKLTYFINGIKHISTSERK